ncbi:MAG: nucleoside hydrolase [Lachnospiraceae bacterium]|nr:nucleoside hydrolase [Lachnospiraceae bacterium]
MKKNLMLIPAVLVLVFAYMFITSDNDDMYNAAGAETAEETTITDRTISVSGDAAAVREQQVISVSADAAADVKITAAPVGRAANSTIPDEVYEKIREQNAARALRKLALYEALQASSDEEEEEAPPKINMVVDLDYDTDVDDVVALRIAAQLHRYERIRLMGVMASSAGEQPCQCMHAQLCHDGLSDIPVGMARNGIVTGSPYWKVITDNYFSMYGYKLYDSVELYKKAIRECIANDEKLRIVTTGYLTNIEALLKDPQGYALVKSGVESIWITGGVYPKGYDHNLAHTEEAMQAANYVSLASPVPLVYSSQLSIQNEAEDVIMVGGMVLASDTYQTDPVTLSFRAYEKRNNTSLSSGRFAWDPFCVWAAGLSPEETLTHTVPINMTVATNGWNEFSYEKSANSSLLLRDTEDLAWYTAQIEAWDIAGISGYSLPSYAFIIGNPDYEALHPDEEP